MADVTFSAEQIEQLLKCPVCLDRFNQPKILPCQHTFCKSPCLQGLIGNNGFIKCPLCRAQHLLPWKGIDGFATNITIAGFLDLQARAPVMVAGPAATGADQVDACNSSTPVTIGCGVCNADLDLVVLCHHCAQNLMNMTMNSGDIAVVSCAIVPHHEQGASNMLMPLQRSSQQG